MSPSSISPLHVGTGQLGLSGPTICATYTGHRNYSAAATPQDSHGEKAQKSIQKYSILHQSTADDFFFPAVSGRSSRPHLTFSPPLNRRRSPASLEITRRDYLKKTETKWSTDI